VGCDIVERAADRRVVLIEPPSLTQAMIEAVNDPEYVVAVKNSEPLRARDHARERARP